MPIFDKGYEDEGLGYACYDLVILKSADYSRALNDFFKTYLETRWSGQLAYAVIRAPKHTTYYQIVVWWYKGGILIESKMRMNSLFKIWAVYSNDKQALKELKHLVEHTNVPDIRQDGLCD